MIYKMRRINFPGHPLNCDWKRRLRPHGRSNRNPGFSMPDEIIIILPDLWF